MNKLPKQVYTKEFRENAVKLVVEERLRNLCKSPRSDR